MNPNVNPSPSPSWKKAALLALPPLAAFLALYVFFPYIQAYGSRRDVLLHNLWLQACSLDQGAWNYCLAVPFIAGWMVWSRREEWRGFVPEPERHAVWIVVLGGGLFLYWAGFVADIAFAGLLSIHLFLAGSILALLGRAAFLRLLSPWLFLLFAYPMPFLDNMVAFPLRLVMTKVAHAVLTLLGLDNVQIGTAIVSAAKPLQGVAEGALFSIDVADPCSGIRSLFALLMMSALYGYFTLPPGWRRGALVLLAVPLALTGNVVRIVLLVIGVLVGGAPFAIGTLAEPSAFHEGVGLLVYAVALGGLVLGARLLGRRGSGRNEGKP